MRHHVSGNKDSQADNILSDYSVLLRGKSCYVRTVLRRSCVSARHLPLKTSISMTMMTAVFLELKLSRLLDRHPERCYVSTKLNGVTKQNNLSSNSVLIPETWPAVQTQTTVSVTQNFRLCRHVRYKSVVNNKELNRIKHYLIADISEDLPHGVAQFSTSGLVGLACFLNATVRIQSHSIRCGICGRQRVSVRA
jgi:hypothetical protein